MAEDEKVLPPAALDGTTSADPHAASASRAYLPSTDVNLPAVPGYELLERIGQGGMGVVYRARHVQLGRLAAVKLLSNAATAGPDARARFLAEAQVVAHARHPHVVEVFDYGEAGGAPYLVMELLAGGSLAGRLKAGRPAVAEAVGLLTKIARAVAAVHARGVVHRDLKPGNVLFDAAGVPKVTDFGLAKRPDSDLTGTHAVMGTAHYMAPEQARGQAKGIGPAADVWALGVVLYECLTGARPFAGETAFDVMTNVVTAAPVPVRGRNAAVPTDLAAAVERCLRKDAAERYPTAADLADALDRVRPDGPEPQTATVTHAPDRPPPVKWPRGRLVGAVAVAVAALLAGGVAVVSPWPKAEPHSSAGGDPIRSAIDPPPERPARAKAVNAAPENMGAAPPAQGAAPTRTPTSELWTAATRPRPATLTGHGAKVTSAVFSPDGTRVVTAGEDKTARVWDATTGAEVLTLKGHPFGVNTAAYSPDGSRIVTAGHDAVGRVWDARTGAELLALTTPHATGSFYSAAFSPDGTRIVAAATAVDGAAVWDAATGRQLRTFTGHGRAVSSAAFSPDGAKVVTAGDDGTAKVWDAKTGADLLTFKGHADWVRAARFSPDGTRVVSASWDRTVKVWDAKTGAEALTLRAGEGIVHSAAFSPDGTRIVTAGGDYLARVWDAASGRELVVLKGHERTVFSAAFSPDGTRIVTAGDDGTARVWAAR